MCSPTTSNPLIKVPFWKTSSSRANEFSSVEYPRNGKETSGARSEVPHSGYLSVSDIIINGLESDA